MEKLIPCRFHIEVGAVLKSEGMRITKQRLEIWDELSSTDAHRDIETILKSMWNIYHKHKAPPIDL